MKNTKALIVAVTGFAFASAATAGDDHVVNAYVKRDGTYVAPTVATNPNATKVDNYSSKGNVNPATGKVGTVDPYKLDPVKSRK
jgi:hypothetical protein